MPQEVPLPVWVSDSNKHKDDDMKDKQIKVRSEFSAQKMPVTSVRDTERGGAKRFFLFCLFFALAR